MMEPLSKKFKMDLEGVFFCNGDDACFKTFKSKQSLKRHVKYKHPYCQKRSSLLPPTLHEPVNNNNNATHTSSQTQTEPVARAGIDIADHNPEAWYKYLQTKQDTYCQSASTSLHPPALHEPVNNNNNATHTSSQTQTEPVARAGIDFVDHDPEARYNYKQMKEEMSKDRTVISTSKFDETEEMSCSADSEQQRKRLFDIVVKFFAFWSDDDLGKREIGSVAKLLIKHSRNVIESERNYLAVTMSAIDRLYRVNRLDLTTLLELIDDFIACVRGRQRDNTFDWDCLVIVFTVAHELLMKYPHLYPDLVDMLCEVFHIAGNDLDMLGGWKDFEIYSHRYMELIAIPL